MSIPIPNSLTIILRTKVRDNNVVKYVPVMTIPNIYGGSDNFVYFEPIVKLDPKTISNIPPSYPPSQVFSQFFNENQFYGLLHRTLEKMKQKINKNKTLIEQLTEATKNGTISSNIRATLNTLFKPGNIFYLNSEPFTIHSYNWKNNDWVLQTKFFEKNVLKKNIHETLGRTTNSTSRLPVAYAEVVQDNLGRGRVRTRQNAYAEYVKRLQEEREAKQKKIAESEIKKLTKESKNVNAHLLHGLNDEKMSEFYPFLHPEEVKKSSSLISNVGKGSSSSTSSASSVVTLKETRPVVLSKDFTTVVGSEYVYEQPYNLTFDSTYSIQSDPMSLTLFYKTDRTFEIERNASLVMVDRYKKFDEQKEELNDVTSTFLKYFGFTGVGNNQESVLSIFTNYEDNCSRLKKNIASFKTSNKTFEEVILDTTIKTKFFNDVEQLQQLKLRFIQIYIKCLAGYESLLKQEKDYFESAFGIYEFLEVYQTKNKDDACKIETTNSDKLALSQCKNVVSSASMLSFEKIKKGLAVLLNQSFNTREESKKYYNYPEILTMESAQLKQCIFIILQQIEQVKLSLWTTLTQKSSDLYNFIKTKLTSTLQNIQQQSSLATKILGSSGNPSSTNTLLTKLRETAYYYITLLMQVHVIYNTRQIAKYYVEQNTALIERKKLENTKTYFENLLEVSKQTNDRTTVPKLSPVFVGGGKYDDTDFSTNSSSGDIQGYIDELKKNLEDVESQMRVNEFTLNELKQQNDREIDAISSNVSQLAFQSTCVDVSSPSKYKGFNDVETERVQLWMRGQIKELFDIQPELKNEITDEEVVDFVQTIQVYRIGNGTSFLETFTSALNYELIAQNATTNNERYGENGKYDLEKIQGDFQDVITEENAKRIGDAFKINIFVVNIETIYSFQYIANFKYPYTLFLWKTNNGLYLLFAEQHFLFEFVENLFKWVTLKETLKNYKTLNALNLKKNKEIADKTIIENYNTKKQMENQMENQIKNINPQLTNPFSREMLRQTANSNANANAGQTGGAPSLLTYYVFVDLDLYPGKDGIPYDKKLVIGCQNRYEEIRRAWAELFKLDYKPLSLYHTQYDKKKEAEKKARLTRKQPANYYNNYYKTRRRFY
jgi:hypothetical protein